MAWIKLNNVYMNSTSSSSTSSTNTYTYTTTTAVSTDRYTSTYNNTLSSGTYYESPAGKLYKSYTIMTASYTMDWESCPYSGNTFTIGSRGMSLSLSKNTALTSDNSVTESLMFNKYATLTAESWYKTTYTYTLTTNSMETTWNNTWSKEVMCYDSLVELEELNTYYTAVTAGTVTKSINEYFDQFYFKYRSMVETVFFTYTYTYKNNWTATAPGTSSTTVTVGYGTNTHTESYADKQYTDSVSFTLSSYDGYSISMAHWSNYISVNMHTSSFTIYYKDFRITRTTSYCRISTTRILTNTTVPSITTLTSTR